MKKCQTATAVALAKWVEEEIDDLEGELAKWRAREIEISADRHVAISARLHALGQVRERIPIEEKTMDPDANLKEQLGLTRNITSIMDRSGEDGVDSLDIDDLIASAFRLAELVHALDAWIRGGGFLPAQWRRP